MENDDNVFTRVRQGAEMLDRHFGSRVAWASRIDLGDFDIDSTRTCILGQLFGDYSTGVTALGLIVGQSHGFAASIGESRAVVREWRSLINAAAVAPVVAEKPRVELTLGELENIVRLAKQLHDTENPLAVCELDVQGVRLVLK